MKRLLLLILSIISLHFSALSQNQSTDSTLVTFYPTHLDSISLSQPHFLDTATFHANTFDLLNRDLTIYSTLSNIGTAHKPLQFNSSHRIGFDLSLPAFSNYIKTEKDLKTYLSLLPYSEIRYVMTSGDKEQHLNFRFGRQIHQGLYLSFEYNINFSPGTYSNNEVENNYFWINALYTTKNQRYRAFAYWFRNKLDIQENGGIVIDSIYSQQIESDNSVIQINLSNASNFVKVSGAGFQHYFNLLPKYKKDTENETQLLLNTIDTTIFSIDSTVVDTVVKDSLQRNSIPDSIAPTIQTTTKRKFTLGRINHSFAYQRNQLFYNETSASLPFYAPFDTLLNARSTDTTIIHAFRNSLKWNSLGYQSYSNDIPFYLYAGINYDFYKIKRYDYLEADVVTDRSHSQVILDGGVVMNLFGLTTVTGHAQLVTLGYQIGDFDLRGQWKQRFGKNDHNFLKDLYLTFDIDLKHQSPTWFETKYYSNHFRWENDFHAATYLNMDLHAHYQTFQIGVKNTTINDLIYFNTEARPTQHDGIVSISELYGSLAYSLWRFRFEGFFCLNIVNNEAVLRLPTFQSRLKIGYSQPIFKKAAILQPSITVQYFTKYHADAYMPALRTFYLQNEVLVGNFPYIDAAIAINVKQADIYVQYSNMFLLTGNHDSFITPHYPMRDSKIFFGVNWRLFN
ncbi:MAG: hypothetical protein IKT08_09825 [Bacteroidales bacterium]|nr:hypothetical protein [Bacteroidales bacterium]